ncbi:(E2-independent) E3 ubiquitin-conjugating enzyme FATS isoform X2 [Anarrhichthys ocellatus]|uniref:(E2-independent) E3 ubiquitin-conjugating enzyme FATS isoform X2 n=1 Tax=Anarrhichthys ocellatus TaxID=433405 RepID=UPI0012ECBDFF|nr:(E2-independent) E3 ubiquitin-conjugating enzyme FATS isoform X2 [Anarrhichthys ocellatus]
MTLRRPAAHLRRAPSWRRSGDESYWESLIPEGEVLPRVSPPQRAPRPQSAIEGGRQLDGWLEHLQRIESELLRAPCHGQAPAFSDWTTSMPALDKEPSGPVWRQPEVPSYSKASSSCGSPSLCESSLGSQESLQTGLFSPPERRGSWERVQMMQTPRKEQAQLSSMAPVKIGWLPIQRRVMMVGGACNQNQSSDHSAGQVKLKQAITPTFQKNRTANMHQDGEVEKSHTSPNALGVKTWQTPDQDSTHINQVPEKLSFPANEEDRPGGFQALRRCWNTNRVPVFPGGSQSNVLPTGTSSVPNRSSQMKTTSTVPLKHAPAHQTTCADRLRNSTDTNKSQTPLHRTGGVQPIRATVPLCRANSGSQPSHIQTNSAVTTLIPQNKAGFSSITISSRKVSRSASLPGSGACNHSGESSSPSMDPNSRQVTVQRKATVLKVTEQRTLSSPFSSTKNAGTPPASHALDTVVHRRKATIIKVTEHRESYSPAKERSGTRHPEYRHSYTEGVYNKNSTWSEGKHSQHSAAPSHLHLDSTKRPNSAVAPHTPTLDPGKNDGTLHRSTLSLSVSSPPAIAAAKPSEVSPKAVGQRLDRPHRPLSCYGNMFGHTEPSRENVTQPAARKWSFGLPQGANINPVNSSSSFVSRQTAVEEAGHLVADTPKPNGGQQERLPPENALRRASSCLTLIKAPDPNSHQSQEEVLALNAAAIIANIKLQRQLSKKKTPNGKSEKDSAASPEGNTVVVTDEGKRVKSHLDERTIQHHNQPNGTLETESSPKTISLQDALQRSRPDFISRSQGRLRELERRAQERRDQADSVGSRSDAAVRQRRARSGRGTSLNDNFFKPRDRAITGKEMQSRSKRPHAEVKRKKEEEKKREVCLSNRQRVELFKKKLLDQILQRSNS